MSSWLEDRSRRIWGAIGVLLGPALVFVVWSFIGTFGSGRMSPAGTPTSGW